MNLRGLTLMSKKIFVMIVILLIVGILVAGFFFKKAFLDSPFKTTLLAENVLISSEWKEIDVKDRVTLRGDGQFLSVNISPPFEGDFDNKGVRTPDGKIVNFEVKIVDEEGNEYPLPYEGFLGKWHINYGLGASKLPSRKNYAKILIRSDVPIEAKRVLWVYFYRKDMR